MNPPQQPGLPTNARANPRIILWMRIFCPPSNRHNALIDRDEQRWPEQQRERDIYIYMYREKERNGRESKERREMHRQRLPAGGDLLRVRGQPDFVNTKAWPHATGQRLQMFLSVYFCLPNHLAACLPASFLLASFLPACLPACLPLYMASYVYLIYIYIYMCCTVKHWS